MYINFKYWFAENICDVWYYAYRLGWNIKMYTPWDKISRKVTVWFSVKHQNLYVIKYRLMFLKGYTKEEARNTANRLWEMQWYKEFHFSWASIMRKHKGE